MIKMTPMTPSHLEQVITLSVADEQLPYVGTVEQVLLNADDKVHPHLVLDDYKVVGIFLIDTTYSRVYEFATAGSLGFRAFLIDINCQGRGYGSAAMSVLGSYLAQQYPQYDAVYLTVNCKNPAAYRCYLNNGFVDNGDLYLGGAAGPQHIMSLQLNEG